MCHKTSKIGFLVLGIGIGLLISFLFGGWFLRVLVAAALISGGEVERHNQVCGDKILNISVFCIAQNQSVGAIIQDVTSLELHRAQLSEKARKVIQKNIITCQKIARDLGEHMAETEILLREVAGSYTEIKK